MAASLVLTAVLSGLALIPRFKVERSNRAAGIVMEGQNVHDIAAAGGSDFRTTLTLLKREGLTGVALSEETVGDLLGRREVESLPNTQGGTSYAGTPETLARLARGIARRSGLGGPPAPAPEGGLAFTGDVKALRSTPVGIDPDDARDVTAAGLVLIARHGNPIGSGPSYIRDVLEESKALGAQAFLALGEQVLGQRDCIEDTRYALKDLGLVYLSPEFAKIAGDAKLVALMPDSTLRIHAVQQAEVDKLMPADLLERFGKAFRERNVRWLLVRPLSFAGEDPIAQTGRFLSALRGAVVAEGGGVKPPKPFADPAPSTAMIVAAAVSCVPWLVWTFSFLLGGARTAVASIVLGALPLAAVFEQARPFVALEVGVMAPVFAYASALSNLRKAPAWSVFLAVSSISLVGGFAVAALATNLPTMLGAKQVFGIKAILMGPVVIVAWMMLRDRTTFADLAKQTIRWGPALLGLALLAAVAVLLVRSGNDAPGAVSETELKIRALLDRFLYTRPRTKEILLGHPALLLGLLLQRAGRDDWASLALVLGSIGSADIVDTLCHIHTPLDIGVARVLIGMAVGGMIGLVLWWAVRARTGIRKVGV
ncbi:MAG: hypothetical protein JST30_15135 [Armatimonadetes bacterium]|nr:hypothetical protein [Armatimonadota bacterium]